MHFAGRFRTVRRTDHAVPTEVPRPSSLRGGLLDVRIWSRPEPGVPLLLVNAGRKAGRATDRNRFRRRIRMALLELLREAEGVDPGTAVIWVRPAKGLKLANPHSYDELKGQLKLALSRWTRR